MTLAALLALTVTLSAEPGALTLGKDGSARIEVRVTGWFGRAISGANVSLTTSVGSINDLRASGDGAVAATFTPPKSRAPAVAIVAADAEVAGEHALGWLALPLSGSDFVALGTKPRAKVELRILDRTFGPVTADDRGNARIAVVVPPGVDKATMHVEDPLGNVADRSLDLDPPSFAKLRLLPVGPARGASDDPLELQAFVVRRDGSFDGDTRIVASADVGQVRVGGRSDGVTELSWRPPRGAAGSAVITVQAAGDRADVRAVAVPPTGRGRTGPLDRNQPWAASLGVLGSAALSFSGTPGLGGLGELAVRVESLPVEALLEVGGASWLSLEQIAPAAYLGRQERARPGALIAQVGARATHEVLGLDLHGALLVGLQHTGVSASSGGTPPLTRTDSESGFRAAAAVGASWPLGPGRALVQIETSYTPPRAGLDASLSGVALQFGYLLSLQR